MPASAFERTPPDVWYCILAIATRSPQLPYSDDTYLQAMSLFLPGCKQDRISRTWTRAVTGYRLVCQAWNDTIEALVPSIVQWNAEEVHGDYLPDHISPHLPGSIMTKAHRLEAWHPHPCRCLRKSPCRSSLPLDIVSRCRMDATARSHVRGLRQPEVEHGGETEYNGPSIVPNDTASLVSSIEFRRLEIFIADSHSPSNTPNNLLDRMPALKALSWGRGWTPVVQHKVHRYLTHLSLTLNWNDLHSLQNPVCFATLDHLLLTVRRPSHNTIYHRDERREHLDLSTWATFPVLRTLCLWVDNYPGKSDVVLAFLSNCGATLSSLKLALEYTQLSIKPETWKWFPRLVEFGPGIHSLMTNPAAPPASFGPLTILVSILEEWKAPRSITCNLPKIEDVLSEFVRVCIQWRVKTVTMVQTWEEIHDILGNDSGTFDDYIIITRLPRNAGFYLRLLENGIHVCDRNGVSAEDASVCQAPGATEYL